MQKLFKLRNQYDFMLSVTSLSSYSYCPRKLFITSILEIREPEKAEFVAGNIHHKVFDAINKKEKEIVEGINDKKSEKDIKKMYLIAYSSVLNEVLAVEKEKIERFDLEKLDIIEDMVVAMDAEADIRAENVFNFIEKHNIFGKELWEKLEPKIETEVRVISEDLDLSGIVDRLEIYKDFCIPYEIKTGKTPREGIWPGHKIQISAYALMIENVSDKKVKEGYVVYAENNEKRKVLFNPFLEQEVKQLIHRIKEMFDSMEIPKRAVNDNKCVRCGLKDICFNDNRIREMIEKKKTSKQIAY